MMSRTAIRRWLIAAVALACVCLVLLHFLERDDEPKQAFNGKSSALRQTVIVPTLDTPAPADKSIVWCSTFQIAWNRLAKDVANRAIQVRNAELIADRLNRAKQSQADLVPDEFYAAAGMVKDGIIEKIQADMTQKFPQAPRPEFDLPQGGAVAYAYLRAGVRFKLPFFENHDRFLFTDSRGKQTAVSSFGIRKNDDYAYHKLRQQVQILYCPKEAVWRDNEVPEFVLDPCGSSQPHQVILARIERKDTLAQMVADVEAKIKDTPPKGIAAQFNVRDTLLIPNLHFRIEHDYQELQGEDKVLLTPPLAGLHFARAFQMLDFKLDRSGVELTSEAKQYVKPGASFFHFNRPFLIYLKKRDAQHPFFVMWVDNSELLCK
jgi:hypothetical protein